MRGVKIVSILFAGLVASLSPASADVGSGIIGKAVSVDGSFTKSDVIQVRHHRHWRRHHRHRRWRHRHHRRHWYGLRIHRHHHHRHHH